MLLELSILCNGLQGLCQCLLPFVDQFEGFPSQAMLKLQHQGKGWTQWLLLSINRHSDTMYLFSKHELHKAIEVLHLQTCQEVL